MEANLRFLSANLQLNSIILNTLNNPDALDENQNVLNNLLNWLKSLSQLSGLNQSEQILVDSLKDSVRKAKSIDIFLNKKNFPLFDNTLAINKNNENPISDQQQTSIEQSEVLDTEPITNIQQISNPEETNTESTENSENIEQSEIPESFIYKDLEESDRWDYLANINSFIQSYEHLMHLLLPNLAFEVVKELHRFNSQNKMIITEAISYPSVLIQNLITKFLREAPGSNLFRRIRRIKLDNEVDINIEQAVNIGERQNIKQLVGTYFNTISDSLDPKNTNPPNFVVLEEKTKNNLKQFSLGPATVEMRVTAVIKHVTESAFNDAEQAIKNENASLKTKIIYLATTQLMCDFQNFLLSEPRIVKFLEELKS